MDAEGHVHETINIAWSGHGLLSIDTVARIGKQMMAYGQTEIQRDLYDAADAAGATIVFEADRHRTARRRPPTRRPSPTAPTASTSGSTATSSPAATASTASAATSIPAAARTEFAKDYPFGWLGILSETPPLPILMYARHERGFALCSHAHADAQPLLRAGAADRHVDDWPDDRFWTELLARVPADLAAQIVTGPSIEKSLAPLRSFVCEPMRHGRLFLAGDAAHIVPPTGAKGLNLAVVRRLRTSPRARRPLRRRRPPPRRATRDVALRGSGGRCASRGG